MRISRGYEKGAYVSADSPYRSFFKFNNEYELAVQFFLRWMVGP